MLIFQQLIVDLIQSKEFQMWGLILVNFLLSFLLGSIVGLSELLSRYTDPAKVFNGKFARLYICLNGIISILGYCALKNILGKFVVNDIEVKNILISGLSSMVLLRSSIANINVGGKNVEVGVGALLQIFLDTVEKLYNRQRSKDTLGEIEVIMEGVDFEVAKLNLPSICLNTFQTLSEQQMRDIGSKIQAISDNSNSILKSIELGIVLEQYFGKEFLEASVKVLEKQKLKYEHDPLNQLINNFN